MSADPRQRGQQRDIEEWGHEDGDRVDLHDGESAAIIAVVPEETRPSDYYILFERLREIGYGVEKEYESPDPGTRAAFRIQFPDETGGAP